MTQDSPAAAVRARPPWFGPGEDDPGTAVAGSYPIAKSKRLTMTIDDVRTHAQGLAFRLVLERSNAWKPDSYDLKSWTHSFNRRLPRAGRLPALFAPEVLRVSVRFEDGSLARSIDPGPWILEPGEAPAGPVLVSLGGENLPHRFTQHYWVWPKPEGEVTITCEWRSAGVSPTAVRIPLR
ncbi:MAG: hypothetical protein WD004_08705 [Actinomycetota bacterium]